MYSPLSPTVPTESQRYLQWGNLKDSTLALTLVNLAKTAEGPILFIAEDILHAQQIYDECAFFSAAEYFPLVLFPDRETLPYDSFSPYQDLTSDRLKALAQIPLLSQGLIFTAASSVAHKLLPREFLGSHCFAVKTGDIIEIDNFRLQLEKSGYTHVGQVMEHGEYAIRGSIIDVFPMGTKQPIRLDLFDTEIDSIRFFNPDDQCSTDKITELNLLPAHEFPMDDMGIAKFRQNWRERFAGNPSQCPIYQNVSDGIAVAGIEYYLPLFFDNCATIFNYLPANTLIVKTQAMETALDQFWKDIEHRYDQYGHDITRPLLSPGEVFIRKEILFQNIKDFSCINIHAAPLPEKTGCSNFQIDPGPDLFVNRKARQPLKNLQEHLEKTSHPVLFTVESVGRREALLELLKQIQLAPMILNHWHEFLAKTPRYSILTAPVQTGFKLANNFEVITESQLFGEQVYQKRRQKSAKYQQQAENVIRNLMELNIDDAIVHIDHGIGRYKGLQTLTIAEQTQEFLVITYADEAKLYVPVTSLHLISRYGSPDSNLVPLHRLGTEQWSKAKQKAVERVRDVAAELLAIYAQREAKTGYTYQQQESYLNFANGFPFEETPDQAKAIEDVLADMTSNKAMDRLVCGDVGFGKTEVAMRAAFVAAENNKQVVMLVPTTLLAQQHYQTFSDRFADWPIKIEMLSRFKTKKETDAILAELATGKIDIVVGTHKLLQKQIKFSNLGLLIIDEEHRFGVQQKERLKALRSEVDILTLTATPIPRTLNMALSGVRDLSLITTPPSKRLSVKTFVYEWRKEIIREAILRELQRGGQVYFLHNNLDTIEKTAYELQEVVPGIKLAIGHGQMRERQLEKVMNDFYHHRINVLVCTTIIESGIDVPTANTIIINRADKLGLAQLHQLRGRVGRSHHQAYAYLLTPDFKGITEDAKKRLDVIATHEDLGSGYMLANHDLEIRGAGEFLGKDQSGQIQAIGFTLYMELLERAVNSLKAGHVPNFDEALEESTEVDLKVTALIPENFIPDVHTRLIIYKRIANGKDHAALKDLQIELIDRFGLMPEALKNLFAITELKLRCEQLGIKKLESSIKQGKILFAEKPAINPAHLIKLIQLKPARYKLAGQDKLNFFFKDEIKSEHLLESVEDILNELSM